MILVGLQGQITLPSDRSEITGGDLVLVVGNALFDQPRNSLPLEMRRHVEQNTADAISILHKLLTGLDVNVKFSGCVIYLYSSISMSSFQGALFISTLPY